MEALATLLTRERTLMELLVFKLVTMRQLLLSGETRFLAWAAEEVERATEAVRAAELERAVLVTHLADQRVLTEPSLTELLADAPEPWTNLLQGLRTDLLRCAEETTALLHTNRRLAEAGDRSLSETLGRLTGEPVLTTYGRDGRIVR